MSVFDAKQFLGDLGFAGEELDKIAPAFSTPERVAALEKSVKRQSDYSRAMDAGRAELETQRQALADKEAQVTAEAAAWANLTAQEKAQSGTLRQQLEASQAEALRHRQQLERLAQEAGVDPKTLIGDAPSLPAATPAPAAAAPAAVDTSKFATADAVGQLARMALQLPAQIADLKDEHFALTGQRLNTTALVAELEKRAGTRGNTKPLDIRAIWEETHNIADVRATAQETAIKAREDAAYKNGRESALTESSLPPGAMPSGKHATIFQTRSSVLQRPQPGDGLQAAINALATGKYKQSNTSTT